MNDPDGYATDQPPPLPRRARRTGGISLGRIFGIPITAGLSWVVIVALLTWSLQNDLDAGLRGWLAGAFGAVMFLFGVLLHEVSHSVVAIRRGVPVKRIRLMVFGGMSELAHEAKNPGDEFLIAASGPVASAAMGVLFLVAASTAPSSMLTPTLRWVGWINLWLAVTNLLPGIPLDGGRVLRSAIWKATGNRVRATRVAARAGQVLGGLVMLAGLMLFGWLGLDGLWIGFIGWILFGAASVSYAQPFTDTDLLELPVDRVMHPVRTYVSPAASLETVAFGESEVVPVMGPWGDVLGVLHRSAIDPGKIRQVRDAMIPIRKAEIVQSGTSVGLLLAGLGPADFNAVVLAGGEPVGIVRPYDLTEYSGRSD
jgi:Zn-dependent protease